MGTTAMTRAGVMAMTLGKVTGDTGTTRATNGTTGTGALAWTATGAVIEAGQTISVEAAVADTKTAVTEADMAGAVVSTNTGTLTAAAATEVAVDLTAGAR